MAVLVLMNTYPLLVSEDLVFRSKQSTMQDSVTVIASSLAGLETLTEENVKQAMAVVEETGISRILITDESGRILYDTRETGSSVGEYAVYTEVVLALTGNDAFSISYQGGAFRSRSAAPVLYQNQVIGAVYAYEYDTEQASLLKGFQSNLRNISLLIAAVVLVLSAVLSRALTRQISELLSAIRSVREGAYGRRAVVRGRDELAEISQEFNSLTDRLQKTEEARRRFVSDASHELKTPLAAIQLLTDSILQTENIDPATTKEFVADIGQEAQRLTRITEDLLQLTRLDSGLMQQATVVDVLPVLQQVLRMMELVATERDITLTYEAGEGCLVCSTRDELHQVIYNLVDNAIKYSGTGGRAQVKLFCKESWVTLMVEDNGVGIPEADLPKVFDRFYRVDKARSRAAGGYGDWGWPSFGIRWSAGAALWRPITARRAARCSLCVGPWPGERRRRRETRTCFAVGAGTHGTLRLCHRQSGCQRQRQYLPALLSHRLCPGPGGKPGGRCHCRGAHCH